MVFRFVAGLLLAMSVSLADIWLEQQTLSLHRELSLQQYQSEILQDWKSQHLLAIERLRAAQQQAASRRQPGTATQLSSQPVFSGSAVQ
ncbi:MAG: hypothetical protein ACPGXX_01055 [Planctomycetaceae bacterium]